MMIRTAIRTIMSSLLFKNTNTSHLPRRLCSYNRGITEIPKSSSSTISSPDILMQNLRSATSVDSVLQTVASHRPIMNSKHVMQALRSIFSLQKQEGSQISNKEIIQNRHFENLCYALKVHAGTIDIHETIEALKVVSFLGVKPDSMIIQILLQLIRHNINSLNLHHMMFLDFILSHLQKTPLIEALKMALPLVFQIHYEKKMDRENVSHLAEYLLYASKNDLSEKCLNDITKAILQCDMPMDIRTARSIVWSVTDLPPYEFLEPLLKKALKVMTINIDDIHYGDIESTLSKLMSRYSRKFPFYYDSTFVDTCINVLIDKDLGFMHSMYMLRKIARVFHHNRYLLDYILKKVEENPELILKSDPVDIFSIVSALTLTEYRPVNWEFLKGLIENIPSLAQLKHKEIIWTRFAFSLASLGIFRDEILSLCFSEEHLSDRFSKVYMTELVSYLGLCHTLKLIKPELCGLIPQKYSPEVLILKYKQPVSHLMAGALHMALGGEKYVKTNLFSRVGAYIDHAVVFRQGGYPVAINLPNITFIEDIPRSEDNQMALFLRLDDHDYTINNKQLRTSTVMKIKRLEAEGYVVVPIDIELWSALQDYEKIPYLMQNLKEKMNADISLSVNVG